MTYVMFMSLISSAIISDFSFWQEKYYQSTFIYMYIYIYFHRTSTQLFTKCRVADLASGFSYMTA